MAGVWALSDGESGGGLNNDYSGRRWWRLGFVNLGIFYFCGGFGMGGSRGFGYSGKLCESHRTTLIPIDGARHSRSRIDRVKNTIYRSVLDQADVIRLHSNRSVVTSRSNPNDSMRFLITHLSEIR